MPATQFTERPLTLDDAPELVNTLNAISASQGTNRQYHESTLRLDWTEPGMDITKSSHAYITTQGQIAAYLVFWDNFEAPVRPWLQWGVHPDFLDTDLSTRILQWADNRKEDLFQRCPPNTRIALQSNTLMGYEPEEKALKQAGFEPIRTSYQMRIDMTEKPPTPTFPQGISIRNYRPDEDLEAFVHVFRNSFSDHFGYIEEPFEKDVEEFRHWFDTDDLIDPQYFFLVVDDKTGEIAGYVLGMKEEHGDPTVSHIELLGVHSDYRRRGIAQAMLYHAFNVFWENNRKSVTLGVDGDSLTNAVALYERVGMHIHRQYMRYEKVLRDGQELATVAIEA